MIGILSVCGVSLLCALASLILRQMGKDRQVPLLILGTVLLSTVYLNRLQQLSLLTDWIGSTDYGAYFPVLIKGFGICLTVDVCAGICNDCGAQSVGTILGWIGKIEILLLSIPLARQFLTLAKDVLL